MNERVIEVGARGIYAHEPLTWGGYGDTYETIAAADRESLRELAESAINAAMVALAPDIRAAVARLSNAAYDNGVVAASELRNVPENAKGDYFSDAIGDAVTAKYNAHRDLLELLGIPEDGA